MMEVRTTPRLSVPRFSDAEFAELFLNWHDAVEAFQGLLKAGFERSDHELAADACYRRFLTSGVTLRRRAGASAVRAVAQFICTTFKVSDLVLNRLWAGLLDIDRQ